MQKRYPDGVIPRSKWYADIRKEIVKRYGEDADLFCDLLAATSPRSHVRKNWRSASALYKCWKASGVIAESAVTMRTHLPNVRRAFAENLKGNTDVVTIDVWMCRHYGIDPAYLTPDMYKLLEIQVIIEARQAGMTPADYQAAIWQEERIKHGKKPISFMAAVDDERQMEFTWC